MARPRVHSDDELLDAISGALARASAGWSLGEAARAAGVHPATLVKRFGSRHGLLVTLSRRWIASIPEAPRTHDCLQELTGWIDEVASAPTERSRGVAGVAMLLEDLQDEELSVLLAQGWQRQIGYLAGLVAGAQADGALPRAPAPETAAALLLDVLNGAYLRAAAASGPGEVAPRGLLDTLMEGWT